MAGKKIFTRKFGGPAMSVQLTPSEKKGLTTGQARSARNDKLVRDNNYDDDDDDDDDDTARVGLNKFEQSRRRNDQIN